MKNDKKKTLSKYYSRGNYLVVKLSNNKEASYSIYTLIKAVQSQRILWDRDTHGFHNRFLKFDAWIKVAQAVDPKYDTFSTKDKQAISKYNLFIEKLKYKHNYFLKLRSCFIETLEKYKRYFT